MIDFKKPRIFEIDTSLPKKLKSACVAKLSKTIKECAKEEREMKKSEFIEGVLTGKILGAKEANEYSGFLYKDTQGLLPSGGLGLSDWIKKRDVKRAMSKELETYAAVKGLKNVGNMIDTIDSFFPEVFDHDNFGSKKYTARILLTSDEMKRAAEWGPGRGTCIYNCPAVLKGYERDTGTIMMECIEDGVPKAYARLFIMDDKNKGKVLGLDNIEAKEWNFYGQEDAVKALTIASMQLCIDGEFDFLIAADERLKYRIRDYKDGIRRKRFKLKKIGDQDMESYVKLLDEPTGQHSIYCYSFNLKPDEYNEMKCYSIFRNFLK